MKCLSVVRSFQQIFQKLSISSLLIHVFEVLERCIAHHSLCVFVNKHRLGIHIQDWVVST